jgi:hypothetical protein
MTPRGTLITALILIGLGAERLLNLYLLGGGAHEYPVRFGVGVANIVFGALLLALSGYVRLHPRR